MIKTRFGLFSGVFLIVVGTAHNWSQPASAQSPSGTAGSDDSVDIHQASRLSQSGDEEDVTNASNPARGGIVFRGFLNNAVGGASIQFDVGLDALVVSGLTVSNRSTAVGTACPPPSKGSEVVFNNDDAKKAGDKGFTSKKKDITIGNPNHSPQPDLTSYFVQLDKYWGISCTTTAWVTDPIPIGFRTSGSTMTACADFNVDPIFCSTVQVEFKAGSSTGMIVCPAGSLFSVPGGSSDNLITLKSVATHATCTGGGCAENAARDKATLEFVFSSDVSATPDAGCTVQSGTSPFSAKKILIKPVLSSCSETCTSSGRATDDSLSRGGNTPPIRRMSFLTEFDSTASNRALVPGSFIILDEAIGGDIPTVGTWGLVVMVQLVLVAGTVVFRRRLPMISAF